MVPLLCVSVVHPSLQPQFPHIHSWQAYYNVSVSIAHCGKVQGGVLTVQVMGSSDMHAPARVALMHGGLDQLDAENSLQLRTSHGRRCHTSAEGCGSMLDEEQQQWVLKSGFRL